MEEEIISFVRGDSQPLAFEITDENDDIVPFSMIDKIDITCRKRNEKESRILFHKDKRQVAYDNQNLCYIFSINPEDTRELSYGEYNFDIQVTFTDGIIQTLKSKFILTDEDTIYGGE